MNYKQTQKNNKCNDLLQAIISLSSHSKDSSNIILQAISSGLASGISQGIASGNISVTFDDILSLANNFKPSEEIPLQLVAKIPTDGDRVLDQRPSVPDTNHWNESMAKVLSNPCSHDASQASPGFPSSVHVFDVTTGNCPAHELSVSQWVSETGDDGNTKGTCVSIDSEMETGGQSVATDKSFSRKRSSQFNNEDEDTYRSRMRPCNDTHDTATTTAIEGMQQLMQYLSVADKRLPDVLNIAHDKALRNNETVATDDDDPINVAESSSKDCHDFFHKNKVSRLVVIERPKESNQVYIADGLRRKYHFSCLTCYVPSLFKEIKVHNNNALQLLFIPRSVHYFKTDAITVFNGLPIGNTFCGDDPMTIHRSVVNSGVTQSPSVKRSDFSTSIGLQTMYSHEQHRARCCMLPHSKPHAVTVRKYPPILIKSIMNVYNYVLETLDMGKESNPFHINGNDDRSNASSDIRERLILREELTKHLCSLLQSKSYVPLVPPANAMFESCTVQPTGALGFHQDAMNCSTNDKTVACIIPLTTTSSSETFNKHSCLSYLFYSRKCVSDYSKKKGHWDAYLQNAEKCDLTRLCLKSILHVAGGVFDYQSSLFEAEEPLNIIAQRLKDVKDFSCPDVEAYCALHCFKHGAAFDKMGYYSIFVNVFFTFYYKGIVTNIDDSICLCMFFGLICNGTSTLAAVFGCFYDLEEEVCNRLKTKHHRTKLFDMLLKLNRVVFKRNNEVAESSTSYGNCKMPRFQYSNHASSVISNATKIHDIIKDFLAWRSLTGNTKDVMSEHGHLMNKLKKVKGVGPLSYNQLWHSMCLCGILPTEHIEAAAVAPAAGPAKLIKMFYPYLTKPPLLSKKLLDVKAEIQKLGIRTINEFILENMMCELWRLMTTTKLLNNASSVEEKRACFFCDDFRLAMHMAKPTRHPDIYYSNPFTGDYQHLFRVVNKELVMRPSFAANDVSGSVIIRCEVDYDKTSEVVIVKWSQDTLKMFQRQPQDLFI